MKRYFQTAIFSLLFLGGIGVLIGYFFFRRTVPIQAKHIPANAMFALTADMREFMLNLKGHPELLMNSSTSGINRSWQALSRAMQSTKGGGIRQTADVQLFAFREDESAWIGIALELYDSSAFQGLLLNPVLQQQVAIHGFGDATAQIDSSAIVIGWSGETALLLYPISNEDQESTRRQVKRLIQLTEDKSLAAVEHFREHALQEFDLGIWINPVECVTFTQSKALAALCDASAAIHPIFIGFTCDFSEGEVILRKQSYFSGEIRESSTPLLLSTTPSNILGYWQLQANPKSLPNHPAAELFFDSVKAEELVKTFTGDFTLFIHDTTGYRYTYIEMLPDENFQVQKVEQEKYASEFGYTMNYVLNNPKRAEDLLNSYALQDSLQRIDSWWRAETSTLPLYMRVENANLIVTTLSPQKLKPTPPPEEWLSMDLYADVPALLKRWPLTAEIFPPWLDQPIERMARDILSLTKSHVVVMNDRSVEEFRIKMRDQKINALIPLIQWVYEQ